MGMALLDKISGDRNFPLKQRTERKFRQGRPLGWPLHTKFHFANILQLIIWLTYHTP